MSSYDFKAFYPRDIFTSLNAQPLRQMRALNASFYKIVNE